MAQLKIRQSRGLKGDGPRQKRSAGRRDKRAKRAAAPQDDVTTETSSAPKDFSRTDRRAGMMSKMEEDRPAYSLRAPDTSGRSIQLPGKGSFPPVDEHLVEAEVTRDEIIGGRRVVAMPAREPHATRQFKLDYVLEPHIASGYIGAADLLTRVDVDSDFASDACIYKDEIDPQTGTRYLEEIAFEVISEQNEQDVTEKALRMHRRGVRRRKSVV